jgi:hypothetical protein
MVSEITQLPIQENTMAKYYDATPIKIKPPVDPKNPEHYVNNADFKEALLAYATERDEALANGKEKPQV